MDFLARLTITVLTALALASALGLAASAADAPAVADVCSDTGSYALCTSAKCIPDPRAPDKTAICSCEVTSGPNFGTVPCDARKPTEEGGKTVAVMSLYSFAQAPTKPLMACPSGKPWTDCLNKPCRVDPSNPLKAICSCAIETTGAFVTYGGSCNTLTCDTAYWSAATVASFEQGSQELVEAMQLQKSPVTYCPSADRAFQSKK
ncbi:hypothetical protein V6C03_12735 [Methyloligella sp. 2.7D]|uniref:hypothetical protein n=1 Tax=unclassified Methyloligella TaxID=2625955 RepID=UPI00157D3E99|nr:hypothetical protein [Methyloligella sp. GL2]QKP77352.1 hypothetical protein HT051_07725 [Methyloligella sp. GL2]